MKGRGGGQDHSYLSKALLILAIYAGEVIMRGGRKGWSEVEEAGWKAQGARTELEKGSSWV